MTDSNKSEFTRISDLSEKDRYEMFDGFEDSENFVGMIGFYTNQVECPEGYEKHWMGDIAQDGVQLYWFRSVMDWKSEKPVLGLFGGIATKVTRWQSDSQYVRFESDGMIRTFKTNSWAFVPTK